jgi:K+-transporting ATPase ATPase B chain
VLFANFAEAMAEGRGKAQADTLRKSRQGRPREAQLAAVARTGGADSHRPAAACARATSSWSRRASYIPGDGEVVEGVASVDESAVTGESAPVIRESGGDRSAVTGGTRVLSDWLVVRITPTPASRSSIA